jgi:hypothetical protein
LNGGLDHLTQDFTVAYSDINGKISYGYIRYFIEYEENIYLLIQVLKQISFLTENHPQQSDVNKFYTLGKIREKCEIFHISQLKCKCAITEISGLNEIFISQATDIEMHS